MSEEVNASWSWHFIQNRILRNAPSRHWFRWVELSFFCTLKKFRCVMTQHEYLRSGHTGRLDEHNFMWRRLSHRSSRTAKYWHKCKFLVSRGLWLYIQKFLVIMNRSGNGYKLNWQFQQCFWFIQSTVSQVISFAQTNRCVRLFVLATTAAAAAATTTTKTTKQTESALINKLCSQNFVRWTGKHGTETRTSLTESLAWGFILFCWRRWMSPDPDLFFLFCSKKKRSLNPGILLFASRHVPNLVLGRSSCGGATSRTKMSRRSEENFTKSYSINSAPFLFGKSIRWSHSATHSSGRTADTICTKRMRLRKWCWFWAPVKIADWISWCHIWGNRVFA